MGFGKIFRICIFGIFVFLYVISYVLFWKTAEDLGPQNLTVEFSFNFIDFDGLKKTKKILIINIRSKCTSVGNFIAATGKFMVKGDAGESKESLAKN